MYSKHLLQNIYFYYNILSNIQNNFEISSIPWRDSDYIGKIRNRSVKLQNMYKL